MDFHGTPTELLQMGSDFSEFLQMEVGDNPADVDEKVTESKGAVVKELNVAGEEVVAKLEDTSKNKTNDSSFKTYFLSGANYCVLGLILMLFISSQILASGCDYWVAFW